MSYAYSEEHLVELPAIELFVSMQWATASAEEETFGAEGTFQRETPGEVVLVARLRRFWECKYLLKYC